MGSASYWQDEALCVINARLPPRQLFAVLGEQNQPPGYHLLLAGWMELFGRSEFAVRMLSALAGLGAVVLLGAMGARLYGQRAWLPALLIGGTSSFWVFWSRDGCMYAVTLLLSALIQYMLLQAALAPRHPPWSFWALCGLLRAGLLYTHYCGFFLIAGEAAMIAFVAWRRCWPGLLLWWLASLGLTLALFAPWVPTFLEQRARVAESWWTQPLGFKRAANVFRQWLMWLPEIDHWPWSLLNGIPLLCAAIWGGIAFKRLMRKSVFERESAPGREAKISWWTSRFEQGTPSLPEGLMLASLLLGGQLLAAAAASLERSLFEPKYLIAASAPFFLVLLGGALQNEKEKTLNTFSAIVIGFFVVAQILSFGFFRYHPGYRNPDMRSVARHILREFQTGDIIVVRDNDADSLATLYCYLNLGQEAWPIYYFDEDGVPPPFWEGLGALPKSVFVTSGDLLGAGQKRVWIPLATPQARSWESQENGLATLNHWKHFYFSTLGGSKPSKAIGFYDRVGLYCIFVSKEFDYSTAWNNWNQWNAEWRDKQTKSALGQFLLHEKP